MLLCDVPVESECDAPVESCFIPCVQQQWTVYFLYFYIFLFCKLPTTVVASSFRGVDSQTHMLGVTHMRNVTLSLVYNNSVQFIFLFVLDRFDSSPYGMFNIFNTFFNIYNNEV